MHSRIKLTFSTQMKKTKKHTNKRTHTYKQANYILLRLQIKEIKCGQREGKKRGRFHSEEDFLGNWKNKNLIKFKLIRRS